MSAVPDRKITKDDIEAKLERAEGRGRRTHRSGQDAGARGRDRRRLRRSRGRVHRSAGARAGAARPCSRSDASDARSAAAPADRHRVAAGSRRVAHVARRRRRSRAASASCAASTRSQPEVLYRTRGPAGRRVRDHHQQHPKQADRAPVRLPKSAMKVVLRNPRRELDVPAPKTVAQLLTRLDVVPESVLVIRNDTLVTHDERLHDDDVVEIRPVISGGARVKCRRCKAPAVIDVPPAQRRVLPRTASSGTAGSRCAGRSTTTTCSRPATGCSSRSPAARTRSASGTCCATLGYDADGLYVGLGIGEYSDASGDYARDFAERARLAAARGRPAATTYGFDVPDGARAAEARAVLGVRALEAPPVQRRRARATATTCSPPATTSTTKPRCCSATCCAGRPSYLGRQHPVLPAAPGFVRKVKPLVRLGERELAGVLRAHRHRLHRRGVPDGRRQPAPRVQGAAQRRSRSVRRARRPRSSSGSSNAATSASRPTRPRSATTSSPCRECGAPTPGRRVRVLPPAGPGRRRRRSIPATVGA